MCDVSKLKLHKHCKTPQDKVAVIIRKDEENIEICKTCWEKIADSDLEWGNNPKPTMKEILARRQKEEAEATLTEYKYKTTEPSDQIKEEEEFD